MGVFNNAIPKYTGNLYNEIVVSPAEPIVPVDDIFDPILNKAVKDRLRDRWGNPIAATFGGYTELINNALLGNRNQGGTMLPGLGILSSFGRSMDKAGDFIIGGVTEGVKGLTGQGIESPLYNIFVEDEDYSGQKLLAAAANSMSKMAGAEVTEDDFRGLWSVPSLGLELATDPSIFGGALTKIAKGTGAVADAGRLLQQYDDVMAKASIDATAPGFRYGLSKLRHNLSKTLGHSTYKDIVDVPFNNVNIDKPTVKAAIEILEDEYTSPAYKKAAYEILKEAKDKVRVAFDYNNLDTVDKEALDILLSDNATDASLKNAYDTLFGKPNTVKNTLNNMLDDVDSLEQSVSNTNEITPSQFLKENIRIDFAKTKDAIQQTNATSVDADIGKGVYSPPITSFRGSNAYLSNMYDTPVELDGITYKNAEAAFQSLKLEDIDARKQFSELSGKQAKALGRKVNLRPDWDTYRLEAMEKVLRAKFEQNPDLFEKLKNTGNVPITETNTWNDTFWGVSNGKGENHLGKLLEKVRGNNLSSSKIAKATSADADDFTKNVKDTFESLSDNSMSEVAFKAQTLSESKAQYVIRQLSNLPEYSFKGSAKKLVSTYSSKKANTLHRYLSKMSGHTTFKGTNYEKATLESKQVRKLFKDIRDFDRKTPYSRKVVSSAIEYRDRMLGDVIKGSDIVKELTFTGKLDYLDTNTIKLDSVKQQFENTAKQLNDILGMDIYKVYESSQNGQTYLCLTYTGKKQYVNKANWRALNKAKLNDIVIHKPGDLTGFNTKLLNSPSFQNAQNLLTRIGNIVQAQSKFLGFDIDPSTYVKHTKGDDVVSATAWDSLVKSAGLPDDTVINAYNTAILKTGRFNEDYGSFFITPNVRSLRGRASQYVMNGHDMFTSDLSKILKSSLSEGMFKSSEFQSIWGVFKSGTFNLSNYVKTDDDLVKVLKLNDDSAGNQTNLILVAPKYNDSGRIVGFKRYDSFSPTARAEALKNPETVIADNSLISLYDSVLRRQKTLSNKAFTFINKNLTLPFKLTCLINPGFLLGNMGDAVLKQATTMSQKYGTNVVEEVAKIYEAHRAVVNLNNNFSEVFDIYCKQLTDSGISLNDDDLPELLSKSPAATERFVNYLNGTVKNTDGTYMEPALTPYQKKIAKLYLFMKNVQGGSFVNVEVKEMSRILQEDLNTEFYKPSFAERLTTSKSSYKWNDISTWDVWHNNIVARGVLDSSEALESFMREAMIYNDLIHAGLDVDEMLKLVDAPKGSSDSIKLRMGIVNAMETMNNANFDYANMPDTLDFASKFIPFPTFYLKNVAYWLNLFIENPQYIDHALAVNEGMWANENVTNDEFKADAKARGAVPMSAFVNNKGEHKLSNFFKGIYKPAPLQSMFTAFNAVNHPIESLTQRVHPLIQGAGVSTERQLNHLNLTTNLFDPETVRYRPYNTDQYQPNINIDEDDFSAVKYTAHKLNPFDRVLNTGLRTPGKVRRGEAQLSDFLPSVFQPDFSKK